MNAAWRILIPSFRFYDRVGPTLALWREGSDGNWHLVTPAPRRRWFQLFFHPRGNEFLATQNLLERLLIEAGADQTQTTNLVSYQIVRELSGATKNQRFKITADADDALVVTPERQTSP